MKKHENTYAYIILNVSCEISENDFNLTKACYLVRDKHFLIYI